MPGAKAQFSLPSSRQGLAAGAKASQEQVWARSACKTAFETQAQIPRQYCAGVTESASASRLAQRRGA